MLTLGDLKAQLREQGVSEVRQVKRCYLESDGHLSVIKQSGQGDDGPQPRKEPIS